MNVSVRLFTTFYCMIGVDIYSDLCTMQFNSVQLKMGDLER